MYQSSKDDGTDCMIDLERGKSIEQIPEWFICPITMDLMSDPVVCMDGHTYERSAIMQHLRRSDRSPMTNLILSSKRVVVNFALRSAISAFRAEYYFDDVDFSSFFEMFFCLLRNGLSPCRSLSTTAAYLMRRSGFSQSFDYQDMDYEQARYAALHSAVIQELNDLVARHHPLL